MCGKNMASNKGMLTGLGSLPRVREKQSSSPNHYDNLRITPACAGKTDLSVSVLYRAWDHSRVCGKNNSFFKLSKRLAGSLPRVREKPVDCTNFFLKPRITPACAGKTLKNPNEIKTFLSF